MLETLYHPGAHRIDYLNRHMRGKPGAFAFYLRASTPSRPNQSGRGKLRLFTGLETIRTHLQQGNLVAIYMDVDGISFPEGSRRPAYQQMVTDMRAGMFRQVFVVDPCDLPDTVEAEICVCLNLEQLAEAAGGFNLITVRRGSVKNRWFGGDPSENEVTCPIVEGIGVGVC